LPSRAKKPPRKAIFRHSGHPGGIKEISLEKLLARKPENVLISAVRGMLPKNRLGRALLTKLKVYAGQGHPHGAQQPKTLELPY
jgi:large subunit ribosomal protein L13